MIRIFLIAMIFFLAGPAAAKTYGPATAAQPGFDREGQLNTIFDRLAKAPNEVLSRVIADKMWVIFMMAPDEVTAEDMNRYLRARGGYNFDKAMGLIQGVVKRHPSYAEGWNQRAYMHFLLKNYDRALADCEKALALEPRHVGCLSGAARILIRHQERFDAGKEMLDRAMKIHPWIHERVLLKEIPGGQ